MQTTFTIQTQGQGLYEFTADAARWLRGGGGILVAMGC